MARYERDPRAQAGGTPLPGKVRMRRDEHGRLVPVREPAPAPAATTEAAERPPFPDDPRPAGSVMPPGYR
ncbi:MAG: hypothetical protein ACXVFT_16215 [Solirubrobacteraceae bacterium]